MSNLRTLRNIPADLQLLQADQRILRSPATKRADGSTSPASKEVATLKYYGPNTSKVTHIHWTCDKETARFFFTRLSSQHQAVVRGADTTSFGKPTKSKRHLPAPCIAV